MSRAHNIIASSTATGPATAEEDRAIRDTHESVLIATGGTGVPRHLHLRDPEEDGVPRCRKAGGAPTRWHRKPIAVYPPGFKPYCTECLAVWREEG